MWRYRRSQVSCETSSTWYALSPYERATRATWPRKRLMSMAQALASPFSAAFMAREMSLESTRVPRRTRSSWMLVT